MLGEEFCQAEILRLGNPFVVADRWACKGASRGLRAWVSIECRQLSRQTLFERLLGSVWGRLSKAIEEVVTTSFGPIGIGGWVRRPAKTKRDEK
jgi:hypothetical protein